MSTAKSAWFTFEQDGHAARVDSSRAPFTMASMQPKTNVLLPLLLFTRDANEVRDQAMYYLKNAGYYDLALELAEAVDDTADFDEAVEVIRTYGIIVG